jgi:hypothetical protein
MKKFNSNEKKIMTVIILKKSLLFILIGFIITVQDLSAQDSLDNGKSFNFPFEKYGISLGNSYEFTGLRLNIADENVKIVNGMNLTFWLKRFKNQNAVVNGISIGMIPTGGTMQPINIGVLCLGAAANVYGLNISSFVIGAGSDIKGLSITGLLTMADGPNSVISGLTITGIGIWAKVSINGITVGGLAVGSDGDINGIASSLAYISSSKQFRGIAVTGGYLDANIFSGIAMSGYSHTNKMIGLSIALYNSTKELHGIQLGLLNYAENNPAILRMLPFINLNFSKPSN